MGSKVKQGELSILDAKPKQDENKKDDNISTTSTAELNNDIIDSVEAVEEPNYIKIEFNKDYNLKLNLVKSQSDKISIINEIINKNGLNFINNNYINYTTTRKRGEYINYKNKKLKN